MRQYRPVLLYFSGFGEALHRIQLFRKPRHKGWSCLFMCTALKSMWCRCEALFAFQSKSSWLTACRKSIDVCCVAKTWCVVQSENQIQNHNEANLKLTTLTVLQIKFTLWIRRKPTKCFNKLLFIHYLGQKNSSSRRENLRNVVPCDVQLTI